MIYVLGGLLYFIIGMFLFAICYYVFPDWEFEDMLNEVPIVAVMFVLFWPIVSSIGAVTMVSLYMFNAILAGTGKIVKYFTHR